ncbi:MAG: hypothetical protein KJ697_00120 [Nanoarchaeota archaeon]|nr:hypothetical protein [Nanoarchaeota archaeon]MBU4124041.1 hypothetical protein [Nanoarchaeota archaeon]
MITSSLDENILKSSKLIMSHEAMMATEVILEDEEMICSSCDIDTSLDMSEFAQDFIWHPAKKY